MTRLRITEAFAQYSAKLRKPQWSVSAWTDDGSIVVSMWEQHRRKGTPIGILVFEGLLKCWKAVGNSEFRENIDRAFATKPPVRLVIVRTDEVTNVEAGEDASKLKNEFFLKPEVVGRVTEWDRDRYAITFTRMPAST